MAETAVRVLEGVFAINKPPSLSSAQVIRDLQHAFKPSNTFQLLLKATKAIEEQNQRRDRHKRRKTNGDSVFKIGHGGTLDPLATGVLIVGIGRGTKSLQDFLDCTKTYETVVLFGKSTDTYDVAGKVVATAGVTHIDKDMVENRLQGFRGAIEQTPPIYSALKIDGMKAYDYARSGKELPRELAARKMNVSECVMTEWYPAGSHQFRWPVTEAPEAEKEVIQQLSNASNSIRRSKSPSFDVNKMTKADKAKLHTHEVGKLESEPADAPAVRVRLTVSSGFYVRSFAHDLGLACGSYATMAELARTRQGDYSSSDPAPEGLVPALDHADLEKGEDSWGPKITKILEKWVEKNPAPQRPQRTPRYDARSESSNTKSSNGRKRRNSSSSPE